MFCDNEKILYICAVKKCPSGEIGIHATLSWEWPFGCASSSLVLGTINETETRKPLHLQRFYCFHATVSPCLFHKKVQHLFQHFCMIEVTFSLDNPKREVSTIRGFIRYAGKRYSFPTGESVKTACFSKGKCRECKEARAINNKLVAVEIAMKNAILYSLLIAAILFP
mgnify:CR=1 FL=1